MRHKSPCFVYITFFFFQAYHSIAKCVAALAMSCPADRQSVVNQFVKDIQVLLMYFANLLFYVFFQVHVMVSQCFSSFLIRLLYILLSKFRQQQLMSLKIMKLSDEQALHLGNVVFCKFLNFCRKRSDLNLIFL